MNSLQDHIKRVNEKLQLLLKQYHSIHKENEKLKRELELQKQRELEIRQKSETLQQQVAIIKASSGQIDEASKKELEKHISHYIREIDRCLEELGSH
mgnify:FL=1